MAIGNSPVYRILVIRGGALGDFILTLPAIRLLREAFPSAHLEILGYTHIVRLARFAGCADAIRSIEYAPLASFFARDGVLSAELVEYFGGFQQIVSYLFDPDEIFAANLRRAGVRNLIAGSPVINDQEHAARQLARPLEQLALYLENPAARIEESSPNEKSRARLALHPGSGSAKKNWPADRFIAIAQWWLAPNEKRKVLLIGGEADEARVRHLQNNLPNDRLELAENLPLPELAARLLGGGIFLGHDSGISHLAAALGLPCLLLFGPSDPAIWAPQNPLVRVLRSPSLTMNGIEASEVAASLGKMARDVD